MTGWNLPPGCNVSDLPGNGPDQPCDVCGKGTDDCICPECHACGVVGDPKCYDEHGHGLVRTQAQVDSKFAADEKERAALADEQYWDALKQGDEWI